jgi:hypothetical protein
LADARRPNIPLASTHETEIGREAAGMVELKRWFLVVYRNNGRRRALDRIQGVPLTRGTLDPYVSRLQLAGVLQGEVVLVDEETGQELALRFVPPPRRR